MASSSAKPVSAKVSEVPALSMYEDLTREELVRILRDRDAEAANGIRLAYDGQRPPWHIVRNVKPRRQCIVADLCIGREDDQAKNLIIEGENLQAMVSLYKYRGQVDLLLADPPYNTGQDFRYNDKWDKDPNDPDLGPIVPADDGSRHTKWLRFMTPRLWMMKEMLKPSGVIAVFIGHDEVYRLGMLMDQIFDERNRLGIINWQKIYKTKKQAKHVATATEYILLYEKVESASNRQSLVLSSPREDLADRNPDNDPEGAWSAADPTGKGGRSHFKTPSDFGLQSPEDGHMYYPGNNRHWAWEKSKVKKWAEQWGTRYQEITDPNCKGKSLVISGSSIRDKVVYTPAAKLAKAQAAAAKVRKGVWPFLFFTDQGRGRPMTKLYRDKLDRGEVPMTFWAYDEYDRPIMLGSQSWAHSVAGTSKRGTMELAQILGDVQFETVKPLELIEKLIHLWCPREGIVLDPFAGTGTTGHAVLDLNNITDADRRFILIEQGRPDKGDPYARSLTAERMRRVVDGKWKTGKHAPLGSGYRFIQLSDAVDANAVLALEKEEMIDLLLTTHWEQSERASHHLRRLPAGEYRHLFAINSRGQGFFLIWNGPGKAAVLDRTAFKEIFDEARASKLTPPYNVYARTCTYAGPNIEFYQIPDRILEKLGFNQATQAFSSERD